MGTIATVIGVGASVASAGMSMFGGSESADAAGRAADAQVDASNRATAEQKREYDLAREDLAPWRASGQENLNLLNKYLGVSVPRQQDEANFDAAMYYKMYPDVKDANADAWEHYVFHGKDEGRLYYYKPPRESFDAEAYLRGNPDIVAAGRDPWEHWMSVGRYENRPFIDATGKTWSGGISKGDTLGAPFDSGGSATPDLTNMLKATPGYQFRLDEGTKAVERGAAARGNLLSPKTSNAIQQYGQDYATGIYENYLNRLAANAGVGQTATNTTVAAGQNYANQVSQNILNAGNARASGYINQANAWNGAMAGVSSAVKGGVNNYLLSSLINQGGGGGFGGGGGWGGSGSGFDGYFSSMYG